MARSAHKDSLTTREIEVLRLLAEGKTNAQIADALGITFLTARNHVASILGKLGVDSREEAARSWRAQQRPSARATRWTKAITAGWALKLAAGAAAAVAVTVAVAGGLMLAADGGDDLTAEERLDRRDELVASEALVADIDPGALIEDEVFPAAIGIVLLRETGWTLTYAAQGFPFAVVTRDREQFAQVQPGCYYAFSAPDEPLPFVLPSLPGLDAPLPLNAHADAEIDDNGGRVTYHFDPGDGGGPYDATEDLSRIDSGILRIELVRPSEDGTQQRTAYTLREATDDESETARETITSARGSESAALWGASIWIDEEPGNGSGEWSWPVLRECPGLSVGGEWIELRPGEQPGDAWVAVGLPVVEWDWDAPHAEQLAAARNPVRRDARVGYETSFLSRVSEDGFIVVHMDGCEETDWFRCEEFPEPEER